jgi:hypothetical protein
MSNSGSNIKALCDEFTSNGYSDEQVIKVLNKFLRYNI